MYDVRRTMYDWGIRAHCAGERRQTGSAYVRFSMDDVRLQNSRSGAAGGGGFAYVRRGHLAVSMYDVRRTMYNTHDGPDEGARVSGR